MPEGLQAAGAFNGTTAVTVARGLGQRVSLGKK
jgi:hypothetical protein